MATFKDAQGELWDINLDAPTIQDVRDEDSLALDLADPQARFVSELATDAVKLVNLIWFLCRTQAAARKISDREFAKRLVGDAIDNAAEALEQAYMGFSRRLTRKVHEAAIAEQRKVQDLAMERTLARIQDSTLKDRIVEAMEARQEDEITAALTRLRSATSTPVSLAFTPED